MQPVILLTTAELGTKLNSAMISIGMEIQRLILKYFTKMAFFFFFHRGDVFLLQVTILELWTLCHCVRLQSLTPLLKAGSTREGC